MFYFTADEHYGHKRVIEYSGRPFSSVQEMDECIMDNFNSVVTGKDTTVHIGDFSLAGKKREIIEKKYIQRLNGNHIFVNGSHDHWLRSSHPKSIWERKIENQQICCCHYAMRTWPKSHYGAWLLFGHSHGRMPDYGYSTDVGVDARDYKPVSFEELRAEMDAKEECEIPYKINQNKWERQEKASKVSIDPAILTLPESVDVSGIANGIRKEVDMDVLNRIMKIAKDENCPCGHSEPVLYNIDSTTK